MDARSGGNTTPRDGLCSQHDYGARRLIAHCRRGRWPYRRRTRPDSRAGGAGGDRDEPGGNRARPRGAAAPGAGPASGGDFAPGAVQASCAQAAIADPRAGLAHGSLRPVPRAIRAVPLRRGPAPCQARGGAFRGHHERDHELPIAYNNLGATQYQLGDYAGAESSYRKSLELLEATQGISSRRLVVPIAGLERSTPRKTSTPSPRNSSTAHSP